MASTLESLPDDLVLKILVENLSAEDILDSARLVCRKWYHMTKPPSFARSHLQHNNTDYALLFMKRLDQPFSSISLSVRHDGRVETSEIRNTPGDWHCGCNGLMLRRSFDNKLYIVNPLTKQDFLLPRIHGMIISNCCVAYAAVSMVYKVVARHLWWAQNSKWVLSYSILTVGVHNSWKRFSDCDTPFYDVKTALSQRPLVTEGGFLHWCGGLFDNQVLTMDVETEIFRETPCPPFPQMYKKRRVFLSTGKYLSLLVCYGEYLWEVWEMIPQTWEWRKVATLSLEAWKGMFEQIQIMNIQYIAPIGWLKYPDVLVFSVANKSYQDWVFSYNLVTQEMEPIRLPADISNYTLFIHRSSLVRV